MERKPLADEDQVEITSRDELRAWLAANHTRERGVWLVTWKKAVPDRHVPMHEIVRECLCFGWVDSLVRGMDEHRSMRWISPRKPGSNWSRVNKEHVAALEQEGLMAPTGRAVIDRAKADGSWSALDDVERGVIPPDLQSAFDAHPGMEERWNALPRSVRRGALERLLNAKRPATRERRITDIVTTVAEGGRPFA